MWPDRTWNLNWKDFAIVGSIYLNAVLMTLMVIDNPPDDVQKIKQDTVIITTGDTLSDWNIFTLALMSIESEFDSTAVSQIGARGYFQITPVYVEEVNRVHHTNYKFSDAWDFEKSYEMFDLMQQAHNKEYDYDTALILHNGDHKWYKKRVLDEMERIAKYEAIRSRLKYKDSIKVK